MNKRGSEKGHSESGRSLACCSCPGLGCRGRRGEKRGAGRAEPEARSERSRLASREWRGDTLGAEKRAERGARGAGLGSTALLGMGTGSEPHMTNGHWEK